VQSSTGEHSELLLAVPIATFEYSAPGRKIVRILLMTIRALLMALRQLRPPCSSKKCDRCQIALGDHFDEVELPIIGE
jgi:hypothetical protein